VTVGFPSSRSGRSASWRKAISAEAIALRIGAENTDQGQRVLDGKTYTRVL